jgi:hypothetical protein
MMPRQCLPYPIPTNEAAIAAAKRAEEKLNKQKEMVRLKKEGQNMDETIVKPLPF